MSRISSPEASVSFCGCCLPIPLLVVAGTVGGAWLLLRRLRAVPPGQAG